MTLDELFYEISPELQALTKGSEAKLQSIGVFREDSQWMLIIIAKDGTVFKLVEERQVSIHGC